MVRDGALYEYMVVTQRLLRARRWRCASEELEDIAADLLESLWNALSADDCAALSRLCDKRKTRIWAREGRPLKEMRERYGW